MIYGKSFIIKKTINTYKGLFCYLIMSSSNVLGSRRYTRKIINIELIKVKMSFNKGREWIGDAQDHILLRSIKMTGQPIHDIIVRPILKSSVKKGKNKKIYDLLVGARRLEAMKKTGKKKVPCIVLHNVSELDAMALSFAENIGRKDFSDYQKMTRVTEWLNLLMNSEKIEKGIENKRIRRESIQEIANIGFGGKTSDVYRILQTANLPWKLQTFIKEPTERTKEEIAYLKKQKIKRDFKIDFKTMSIIEKISSNLSGAPPEEKTEKICELIATFGLDEENYKKRNSVLRSVRDKLKQKSFEDVTTEVKKEMKKIAPNLDSAKFIHYEIPDEYVKLHVKAIRSQNLKSTTLARKVYLQWLEEIENEDVKIQELETELNRLKYS